MNFIWQTILLVVIVACNGAPPTEDPRIDQDRLIREGKLLFSPFSMQLIEPVASPSFIAKPKIKIDGVISGNVVSLYTTSTCINPVASGIANAPSIILQTPPLAFGQYSFYAKQSNSYTESDCTPFSLNYEYVQSILAPSKVERIFPIVALDTNKNPILRVHGVTTGAQVQIYSDANCSVFLGAGIATESKIDIGLSNLNSGAYKFYSKMILSSGISSLCTSQNESTSSQYASYTVAASTPMVSSILLKAPLSFPSPNKRPTFTVTGTIPGGTVKLYRDPSCLLEIGSTPIVITSTDVELQTDLADGTHQVFVRQFDSSNNGSYCSSQSNLYADYAVDSYIREISQMDLLSPLSYYSTSASITVRVRGAETGAFVSVFRNAVCTTFAGSATANLAGDATITINGLIEGAHQFYARQIDPAGNISSCTQSLLTYTRDLTVLPPSNLTLINPVSNFNADNTPEIKVDGLEVGATAFLYLDSSCLIPNLSFGVGSSKALSNNTYAHVTTTPLNIGSHVIYARQVDLAGNRSDCSETSLNYSVSAVVVAEPQSLQMSIPSANSGTNPNPTVFVSGLTEGGTLKLFSASTCSSASFLALKNIASANELISIPVDKTLVEGSYQFYAMQINRSGVPSSCSNATVNYTLDLSATAPSSVSLVYPTQTSSSVTTPRFLVSGVESGARVRLYRDNSCSTEVGTAVAANGANSVEVISSPLSIAGLYTFYAKQVDALGNTSSCSTAYANYELISIGTAPTNLELMWPLIDIGNVRTPIIRVSGIGIGHTVSIFREASCINKVGEAIASNVTPEVTLNTLATDGVYTFYARQKDLQNNLSACSQVSVSYTLDTIALAPTSLSLQSPASSPSSVRTPTVLVSGVELGASVSLYTNSGCTQLVGTMISSSTDVSITTSSLADGTLSIYAKQTDVAGNISSCSSQSLNYTVVSTVAAPSSITLVDPLTSPSTNTMPTVLVSGVLSGATVKVYNNSSCTNEIGSAVAGSTTVQMQTAALAPTIHSLYAQQTSIANITSPCSTNFLTYQVLSSNDVINDPYFSSQWHLLHNGQFSSSGNDVNVTPVWGQNKKGAGVLFRVVDDGMDITHEDLATNYSGTYSWNSNTGNSNPSHGYSYSMHGTSVAGLIAAKDNSIGVRGVAPRGTLSAYNLLEAMSGSAEVDSASRSIASIDVSNNSWGPTDATGQFTNSDSLWKSAIQTGLSAGRGGKGTIYVWAAGNGAPIDNSNYDGYANFYGVIAVAAILPSGQYASYSEAGANLWISAPAGGFGSDRVLTTDRSGNAGYNEFGANNNYSLFNGTSAAAPIIAGVTGLMLEANPNLTWRDVKIILAQSAKKNHSNSSGWKVNGAGYNINEDYGFGLADASAAVTLASTWTNVGTFVQQYQPTAGVQSVNAAIPNNGATAATSSIIVSNSTVSTIEYVTVDVNITHGNWGDLDIILKKDGNNYQTNLAKNHTCYNSSGIQSVCSLSSWTFGVARHLGESPNGTWTIEVWDKKNNGFSGTLASWRLRFHGEY